jgi:N-acetyl-gamma-glutamylphosphate reductase
MWIFKTLFEDFYRGEPFVDVMPIGKPRQKQDLLEEVIN